MADVFVSHAASDSKLAIDIACELESSGYSTWCYERHALPGISYLTQCREAIEEAGTLLLLISEHSLKSHDVSVELEAAHRQRLSILPIRIKISDADFRRCQPVWDQIIGSTVTTELRGSDTHSVVRSLEQAMAKLGIEPTPEGNSAVVLPRPQKWPTDRAWPSDANQIEIGNLRRVVFSNELISDFLQSGSKYFLSASKGLGKTLLLTYKRSLLEGTNVDGTERSGNFVPEGRPYLDFMSDLHSVKKTNVEFLEDLANSKGLWSLALKVAALTCHPSLMNEDDKNDLARLPQRLQRWMRGSRIEPTMVFKEVLDLSRSEINRTIDRTQNFLEQKYRRIHGDTYFFIDKVDQGCKRLSRQAWIAVQAGLIEAAWDLLNTNNHVKIFASIRQEAFSNYESDIKVNLYGATTVIRYTHDDLSELLDRLSQCYEGKAFRDFIGLKVVKHPSRAFPEDSFDYVRRHTLGRPRDFVILSSSFSKNRKAVSQPSFCELVTETSAAVLVPNVFAEMHVFTSSLADKNERLRFLGLIPHNILTREEAVAVWCEFNGIKGPNLDEDLYDLEQYHHPFWELYGTGLLGFVTKKEDGERAMQRFKQPHDPVLHCQSALPHADYYLIHPALDYYVRTRRPRGVYNVFQNVIVGDGCVWEDYFGMVCDVERLLFGVDDSELRECVFSVLKEINVLLGAGRGKDLETVMADFKEWRVLQQRVAQDGICGDLVEWLEVLITTAHETSSGSPW